MNSIRHAFLLALLVPSLATAQYGVLDSTFAGNGFTTFGQGTNANEVSSLFLQGDGSIMVAISSSGSVGLNRFLPDGTLDETFGGSGYTSDTAPEYLSPCALLELSDGTLILAGQGSVDSNSVRLIRFLANGQYDGSFAPDGAVTTLFNDHQRMWVRGLVPLADGRFMVGGTAISDVPRMFLARFLANGTLDPSFNGSGFREYELLNASEAFDMVMLADGRMLLAGYALDDATPRAALLQVLPDGSPDAAFGTNGVVLGDQGEEGDELRAIVLGDDGSILACGGAYSTPTDRDALLVRYTASGALDPGFGQDGWLIKDHGGDLDEYRDVVYEEDGAILVCGRTTIGSDQQMVLDRYFNNGDPETSFSDNGSVVTDHPYGARGTRLALQADGKILVGGLRGNFLAPSALLTRYTPGIAMSISEVYPWQRLRVFPNPCTTHLQLDLPPAFVQREILIMDAQGRVVQREGVQPTGNNVLQVHGLAPGSYTVVLLADEQHYHAAFVKVP